MSFTKIGCTALFMLALGAQTFAQEKTKSSKPVAKQPAPTAASKSVKGSYRTILVPDFFHQEVIKKGDTSFTYELYDNDVKKINIYDLKDMSKVEHIFYFKSYFQYPPKPGAIMSPPYLSKKLYTFEHAGNAWLGIDGYTFEKARFKEFKNIIVRTDTVVITNPETQKKQNTIFKYYKTEKSVSNVPAHSHTH